MQNINIEKNDTVKRWEWEIEKLNKWISTYNRIHYVLEKINKIVNKTSKWQ